MVAALENGVIVELRVGRPPELPPVLHERLDGRFSGHQRLWPRPGQPAMQGHPGEDLEPEAAGERQAFDNIEAVEFGAPPATSGRYQPGGGGGRRIRRPASRTPRRSRMRPIVRTDGTTAGPRATSSLWMARAPYSPRSLVSFSVWRRRRTRSTIAEAVRRTRAVIGRRSRQSTRSKARSPARRHHHCTVERLTSCARATARIDAPARTSATIVYRFRTRRPGAFYPSPRPPGFAPSVAVTEKL